MLTIKTERIAKLITIYGVAIGLIFAGGVWFSNFIEPYWATESEVIVIDKASMEAHTAELEAAPYAMKSDVNSILNAMIDEKIKDATNEIKTIEDMEDQGIASKTDIRTKKRLEKDIELYEKEYIKDSSSN